MKRDPWRIVLVMVGLAACGAANVPANEPPQIRHQPITTAVRGQPISVTARVTDDAGLVKYVTLFYSLSRDAAPFRVPMKASGADVYVGTIPPDLIGGADRVLYYIEAMDQDEAVQETTWQTIEIKSPAAPSRPAAAAPAAPPSIPPRRERANLLGMGIIAGGAAAVLGGALFLANEDEPSDETDPAKLAGTYSGTVLECVSVAGQPLDCENRSMSVLVEANGSVRSTTLREGTLLTGTLSGNRFALVADLSGSNSGVTGEVIYSGAIVEERLFGDITGRSEGPEGITLYSGNFSATRR